MNIFPSYLPRVMPVGRLDLNSEGLLLLTNSGELKESLNCQALNLVGYIGFVSKGVPKEVSLDLLRSGIVH